MPPHSLGSVDWNTTKPASSLAFLLLFVTPRAALQSQLYSFLRLLLRALAEGTYAKGCFWFRRVPQLSHRKRSGNLNRGIHPRSGNLLSTGLMVLAPIDCTSLPPALHGDWQDPMLRAGASSPLQPIATHPDGAASTFPEQDPSPAANATAVCAATRFLAGPSSQGCSKVTPMPTALC